MSRIGKSIETESRLVVTLGRGRWGDGKVIVKGQVCLFVCFLQ